MNRTVNDAISSKLAPVLRKISDLNVKLMGTETQILRITQTEENMLGQTEETLEATIIENVVLQYPNADKRLHTTTDNINDFSNDTESFDLWDVIPIKLLVPFHGSLSNTAEQNYKEYPIALKEGDIIVHVYFDEHDNKHSIVMVITKIIGSFMTRFLVSKHYQLTLVRGDLSTEMRILIDEYVLNLVFD